MLQTGQALNGIRVLAPLAVIVLDMHVVCVEFAQSRASGSSLVPPRLCFHGSSTNETNTIAKEKAAPRLPRPHRKQYKPPRHTHSVDTEIIWDVVVNRAQNNHAHDLHVLRAKCSR